MKFFPTTTCFVVEKNKQVWRIPINQGNIENLATTELNVTFCKECKGAGYFTTSGYTQGEYVAPKYKKSEWSYDTKYTNGSVKRTTVTSEVKESEGYYKRGEKYSKTEHCKVCKGKGQLHKTQVFVVWDKNTRTYNAKNITE